MFFSGSGTTDHMISDKVSDNGFSTAWPKDYTGKKINFLKWNVANYYTRAVTAEGVNDFRHPKT